MTGVQNTTGREEPMIRLCVNCDTENPVDAVICSECGMSLTRAPTGTSAVNARQHMRQDRFIIPATPGQRIRRVARILAVVWAGCWTVLALLGLLYYSLYSAAIIDDVPWVAEVIRSLPLRYGLTILVSSVTAAISWRWERVGAILLLFASWLVPTVVLGLNLWDPLESDFVPPENALLYSGYFVAPMPPLLGLLVGAMLLAGSWRSRTRDLKHWIKQDPLRVAAVVVVVGVALGPLLYYIIHYTMWHITVALFILFFVFLNQPLVM